MNLTQRARIPKRKRFRFGIATKSLEKVVASIRHTEYENDDIVFSFRALVPAGGAPRPESTDPWRSRPQGGPAVSVLKTQDPNTVHAEDAFFEIDWECFRL